MIPGPFVVLRDGDTAYYVWPRPRTERPTSSLRAFYLWLLSAFTAGLVAGALIVSAFSGAPWTDQPSSASSALTSAVHGGPVRAAKIVSGGESTPDAEFREAPDARTTSVTPLPTPTANDETPASRASVLTTRSSSPAGDDPALAVRASPVPRSLVVAVGDEHGIDGARFADVMFCESSLRPDAIGDGGRAWGIAQFHAPTWAASSRRYYGMELAPAMRLDPDLALLVAARKWAAEGSWAWSCAK